LPLSTWEPAAHLQALGGMNNAQYSGDSGAGRGFMIVVIPGRVEDANPESRDSPVRNCAPEV
jgi:hypothetical protein